VGMLAAAVRGCGDRFVAMLSLSEELEVVNERCLD